MFTRPLVLALVLGFLLVGIGVCGYLTFWALAERNLAREMEQSSRASQAYQDETLNESLAILKETIHRITHEETLLDPNAATLRYRLSLSVASGAERLTRLNPPTTEQKQAVAETLRALGIFLEETQAYPQAIPYHQRAGELFGELGDRLAQAICLYHVASSYEHLGRYDHALTASTESIRVLREEQPRQPEEIRLRYELAFGLNHRAQLALPLNRLAQAESDLQEAVPLWESLCQAQPNRLEYQLGTTVVQAVRADLRDRQGQRDEAIKLHRGVLAQRNELARTNEPTVRPWLAETHAKLAALYLAQERLDQAELEAEATVRLRRLIAKQYPGNNDALDQLARALLNLAQIQVARENVPAARTSAEEASALQKRLLDGYPDNPAYAAGYAGTLLDLAETYALTEPEQVVQYVDQAIPPLARATRVATQYADLAPKWERIRKLRQGAQQKLGSAPGAINLGESPRERVLTAIAQEGLGQTDEARTTLKRIPLENAPLSDLYAIAVLQTRLGNRNTALEALRRWAVPYEVKWQSDWYPVRVLEQEEEYFRVHYVGYPDTDDETVPKSRVRSRVIETVRILESAPDLQPLRAAPGWTTFLDAVKDGRGG